ncbi:uncharacterized protein HMPREF1541_00979 [Cyphellophora europaea CBS 101466]|uniref:Histone deacetylase domain-containing protein n=1 Tax=Cyphellophora europaea (strain CBS 101466) TaxID=1220924 RepID=W2SDT8_CYPE1|nr:uncharacterized protein HMPREF1541_00979 [Cyphellophora europaea CBS 101466]ETN46790.1 hypothetical protein HMPREF1541_00979 [Cyphellophora europaea CBS 101466]
MLVLHDPDCLLHSTVEFIGAAAIPAHESPERLKSILATLEPSPLHDVHHLSYTNLPSSAKKALLTTITANHDTGYLQHLETVFSDWRDHDLVPADGSILPECWRFPTSIANYNVNPQPPRDIYARAGFYAFDMSSGIMKDTWASTIASANLAYQGVQTLFPPKYPTPVLQDETTAGPAPPPLNTLLTLCRPPGHHCDGARAGGYCYINNVAVAISTYRTTQQHPDTRVAVLDLDFHHGNGTQELYYADPSVLYVSIHGQDEFPYYTGAESEVGIGAGEGFNVNLPLPVDASVDAYLDKLALAVQRIREYKPAFVVVSLGFDTYETDPIGKFRIATEDYEGIARRAREALARDGVGECKSLVVLEGGYVVEKLGVNLLSWLKGWESPAEQET